MPLIPLHQWICDSCGDVIESPQAGWLEWYHDSATGQSSGFRIVHHQKLCQYNDRKLNQENKSLNDNHLRYFTGHDGLVILLDMFTSSEPSNRAELTEIIRRLHLPNYEEARRYWQEAKADGLVLGQEYTVQDYFQSTLQDIIDRYGEPPSPMTNADGIH